jgi:hypothetical protein
LYHKVHAAFLKKLQVLRKPYARTVASHFFCPLNVARPGNSEKILFAAIEAPQECDHRRSRRRVLVAARALQLP